MGEPINVAALFHSLDLLRLDHSTVKQAFSVAAELQDWLDERCVESDVPVVEVCVSRGVVEILIGECCVWESENYDLVNLTSVACLREYRDHVENLIEPFVES